MDEKPKEDIVVEEKKIEPKGYDYAKDSKKSMRTIAKEVADEQRAKPASEPEPTKEPEPVKEEKPTPPEEPKEDKAIHNQKLVEEAAEKAAEKAREKLQAELNKVEESKKLSEQEKQEKKEDLKSKWAKEGRTPQSYDEIYEEAKTHALEEAKQWFEAREAQKAAELEKQSQAEQEKQAERQKAEDEYRASVEKMTMDEMEELKAEGVNLSNEERMGLFKMGLEINTDRLAKGQPPIISISRIYYNHFKPSLATKPTQPPGADAPIAGPATAPAAPASEKAYVYTRDHNKSFKQLLREAYKGKS